MKRKRFKKRNTAPTGWGHIDRWYSDLVGSEGHYYHRKIVLPGTLRLLQLNPGDSIVDLACGQGILARQIPEDVKYFGIDASSELIHEAKSLTLRLNSQFMCADITKPLTTPEKNFSHATVLLALQNIEDPMGVIVNTRKLLRPKGKLLLVLNHPCFRVPRQSSWGVDETNKLQFRRINLYMSPLKVPMKVHPGKKEDSPVMWAFHQPLSFYSEVLSKNNFAILKIEEWVSDKTSIGKAAKMENRARSEFPLFMAILAQLLG